MFSSVFDGQLFALAATLGPAEDGAHQNCERCEVISPAILSPSSIIPFFTWRYRRYRR
jgi:hypothetical protein